jgi:hypothetical protein
MQATFYFGASLDMKTVIQFSRILFHLQDKELSGAPGYLIQKEKGTIRNSTSPEGNSLINKTLHYGSVQR